MKKYKFIIIVAAMIGLTSCGDDFLTVTPTEKQEAGGAATEGAILSNLGAAYQILLFDSYANSNYNSIPLMSDLRSDDIYKGGGDAGDQHQLYLLSQFTATADEGPFGIWNIYYSGLARCNNVIIACENAVNVNAAKLDQYKAEAHFLRAYYVHWLWKFWGNIPYFEEPLKAPYMAKQYKADEIYKQIMEDLDFAIQGDKLPMVATGGNVGRVTKAAAMMLKARVVLYQKDQTRYAEVTKNMAEIIKSGKYNLMTSFASIWVDENEFCQESIFETNQLPEGKTWGASWQGYGTNLPAFISPNNLKVAATASVGAFTGGWGFGPVRQSTWDIFEDGDTRREASINKFDVADYSVRFQNTGLFMAKYAARKGYNPPPGDQDLNYCNNFRVFRYAETLLNYAEMVKIQGQAETDGVTAQSCLDLIRQRANRPSVTANTANIKLERRREFIGEGIRFWDVVRWGDTSLLNDNNSLSKRTWKDTQKYIPIPQSEIEKTAGTEFELVQNPL